METPWFALLLMVVFYVLVAAEFFLPTAGLAGVGAVATLVTSIVVAWQQSITWAFVLFGIAVISTPPLLGGLVQIYPRTPLGKRILNRRPNDPLAQAPRATTRSGRDVETLVGQIGIAKTDLLPSGWIVIDGEKIDALSVGMPIDRGTSVVVVQGDTRHVRVRPATPAEQGTPSKPGTLSDQGTGSNPDILNAAGPQTPAALEQSLEELE